MKTKKSVNKMQEQICDLFFDGQFKLVIVFVVNTKKKKDRQWLNTWAGLPRKSKMDVMGISCGPSGQIVLDMKWNDEKEIFWTLVHELIHQWQDANGYTDYHGKSFKRKIREIAKKMNIPYKVAKSLIA